MAVTCWNASLGRRTSHDRRGVRRSTRVPEEPPAPGCSHSRNAAICAAAGLEDACPSTLSIEIGNGLHDEMIPVFNSYRLAENLPNAMLLAYPDAGYGSLFQFHESFTRQAASFLASDSPFAPY
jgi:hypothetical protein